MTYDEFSEIFFDVPGWEGYYQININEQVRSLDRYVKGQYGTTMNLLKGRKMTVCLIEGYKRVALSKDHRFASARIHLLLAKTFIPNPKGHKLVRHLNDIKTDNSLSNLAWGTHKDNAQDSIRNGTFKIKSGKDHPMFGRKGKSNPLYKKYTGANAPNSKLVLNTETGIYYDSAVDAAESKGNIRGFSKSNVQLMLRRGGSKNTSPFIYV